MTKSSPTRRSRRSKSRIKPPQLVGNLGAPIHLPVLNLHGVAANSARPGSKVEIWTRLAMTSDERMFHQIAQNLSRAINHAANEDDKAISLERAHSALIVLHNDDSAEVWLDTAAVQLNIILKSEAKAGQAIFERDIVDVTGMDFPAVEIADTDRVICLFREGWRFGLFFDFNPDKRLDRALMRNALGTLYRTMRYRRLYDALKDAPTFRRLCAAGWFPFAEIITSEFNELLGSCEAGFDLAEDEEKIIEGFDKERLERIFSRWMLKPHFAGKEDLLRTAISAFLAGEPIATIKIILTEIEGVLADAYKAVHGKRAKRKTLLAYAVQSAAEKTGAPDTLLFPTAFADYLNDYTFADFDPDGPLPKAGSRHAVGHGAADPKSYTMTRALQAILTLDQLAFYT